MGLEPNQFWGTTLRTYATIAQAHHRRLIDEYNARMSLAWHTAAFQQTKKLPKLSSLMRPYPRNRPQTVDEQQHIMQMIANTFKGK